MTQRANRELMKLRLSLPHLFSTETLEQNEKVALGHQTMFASHYLVLMSFLYFYPLANSSRPPQVMDAACVKCSQLHNTAIGAVYPR